MASLIGRQLGRYAIHAELGRGGMARVYQALDTLLQRQVAIKVLAAQLSLDEEFVRRFEREATTAANLRHPAILTIYDVGEQEGLHYIAMELVNGRSLHAIIEERTTLGLGYAVSLLEPVAQALDYAHAQGAVHRDIKPHNILIDHDGRVLLADFGIAQTPDSDGERLTRTGVFMGTPEYISPEQAEAQRVDGRSDLYSLAVVAYEIITGRVPFAGATPQLIVAHAQLPPPPPTSVLAHLPGELDEVLVRALAKRAEQRYPTGSALIAALRNVAERYGTPLATREQLAGLADAAGVTPRPHIPAPIPSPPPRPKPPVVSQNVSQPTPPPTPNPRPPANNGVARPPTKQTTSAVSSLPLLVIGSLLVVVTLALLFAVAQGLANSGGDRPTATRVASPTLVVPPTTRPSLVATRLPVVAPTAIPHAPVATDGPPISLPAPPTLVPAPPPVTAPPVPPTLTPVPPPTLTPASPVPPTLTPVPPTLTLVPPTLTPVPPTLTLAPPTLTPAPPTLTPAPPTLTPAPPTLTPTEEPPLLGSPTVVTPIVTPYP